MPRAVRHNVMILYSYENHQYFNTCSLVKGASYLPCQGHVPAASSRVWRRFSHESFEKKSKAFGRGIVLSNLLRGERLYPWEDIGALMFQWSLCISLDYGLQGQSIVRCMLRSTSC